MKLNKKGITLIEIIISIALISIVLVFLFSLLVNVKDMNYEAEVNTTYLINKSLILKNIESDLDKIGDNGLTVNRSCNILNDIYNSYGKPDDNEYFTDKDGNINNDYKANRCIILSGFSDGTEAKLGIYYYKNKNSYVISYIHGNIRATRELPDFEKYNVKKGNLLNDFEIGNNNLSDNFYKLVIPIIGSDGKDYSIIISYFGKVTIE